MAKVLIVDDEPSMTTLIRFVLEKAGHEVSEAHNGKEALEALGVEPADASKPLPDVMLLDVMMPILDGIAVARALKGHPRAGELPILVVTAKGEMRDLFDAMPQVAGFFQKPFDPKQLRDAIAKLVPPP